MDVATSFTYSRNVLVLLVVGIPTLERPLDLLEYIDMYYQLVVRIPNVLYHGSTRTYLFYRTVHTCTSTYML